VAATDPRIRPFARDDYAAACRLWERTPGVGLNESDTKEAVVRFLERNPGLSAVLPGAGGELIGAVLCGHDGRRGYLHHLAVDEAHRHQGIARALVDYCFARLAADGIPRCNIFVYDENGDGMAFWLYNGWAEVTWKTLQKRVTP
jgi:N-acetylglutamate synthase